MSADARRVLSQLEERASTTVKASALHGGTFTLPLKLFISDASEADRSHVPSLSFLLVHHGGSGQRTNIVFDLGLRRNTEDYISPIRDHLQTRQPMNTLPDVKQTLIDGEVQLSDIAHIIISQ